MNTLIQITGVQYACPDGNAKAVIEDLGKQRPEVLLVSEHTHDYGIVVRALVGTAPRGVVSRFDLDTVLRMMHQSDKQVLVGHITDTDPEGRNFQICVEDKLPRQEDSDSPTQDDPWQSWQWTGAPLMDSTAEERQLNISIKVVLAELQRDAEMNKQTLLQHLDIVMQLTRWDVSRETQQQLSDIRHMVSGHTDADIRIHSRELRHVLTSLGSQQRRQAFQDEYLPQLCQSGEARRMFGQWQAMHRQELCKPELWKQTLQRQLEAIDESLMTLPADLGFDKEDFGALMHRLLYQGIPARKLQMLLSAIVLRQVLRQELGLDSHGMSNAETSQLAQELAPIFMGSYESAREFLFLSEGKKSTELTHMVTLWCMNNRISQRHCYRPLWTILHKAGIYNCSEANWRSQVCK